MSRKSLIKYVSIAASIMAMSLVLSSYSIAANDMFLNLGTIKGESADKNHKDEINILAWSWGMSQPGNVISGTGKPTIKDITFTKYVDLSSPLLASRCVTGERIASALLTVRNAGSTQAEYIKLTLTDVIVTSVTAGGSGADTKMTENISLNFRAYKYDYWKQNPDGTLGTLVTSSYDIAPGVGAKLEILDPLQPQQNTLAAREASSLSSLLAWSNIK